VFFYSRDRTGDHPERHLKGYAGILQADAYAGFNRLYEAGRKPGPITEAACWAHGRRKFFVLADITAKVRGKLSVVAPLALAAIKRIDAIFDIEREISGLSADERLTVRRGQIASLVAHLEAWMRTERAKLSRHSEVARAMDYSSSAGPPLHASSATGRFASAQLRQPLCEGGDAARRLRMVARGVAEVVDIYQQATRRQR
jgi:hypothetical protein